MIVCLFIGLINHANAHPFSIHSSILSFSVDSSSECESNSTTKSGQIWANRCRSDFVTLLHSSFLIYAASGDRTAPLGIVNPVLESKHFPSFVCSVHTKSFPIIALLYAPVSLPVGAVTIMSPDAFFLKLELSILLAEMKKLLLCQPTDRICFYQEFHIQFLV